MVHPLPISANTGSPTGPEIGTARRRSRRRKALSLLVWAFAVCVAMVIGFAIWAILTYEEVLPVGGGDWASAIGPGPI